MYRAGRYGSLNAHGCLTCSLERSGSIGHGLESSEACESRSLDVSSQTESLELL